MSKGLELLKTYEDKYTFASQFNGDRLPDYQTREMLEPIEKELQEGEEYRLKYSQTHIALCKLREEKTKKEQALEIIKKKGIFVNGLIKSKDLEEYNILCLNHGMTELPTQEEYDLLKEVLINA